MKALFIVYHDLLTEARSQEMLECASLFSDEVCVVAYSKPHKNLPNVKSIVTGGGERNYLDFLRKAKKALKTENADVVILHDNFTAILVPLVLKLKKKPYLIYDSSELYIQSSKAKNMSLKMKIARILPVLENKYIGSADTVIAANLERAQIMKEIYGLSELPVIFDNIHRIDDVFDISECEKKYSSVCNDGSFKILYAGGVSTQRRTFDLVEAVAALGDGYKLIILGTATQSDKEKLNNLIKSNGYSNIIYLGFIPRREFRYLLTRVDVNVSAFSQDTPNNKNCASGKAYEGLFEGKPLLASSNPPLKRLCEEYGVGVSDDDFKRGILKLQADYDRYCKAVKAYADNVDYDGRIKKLAQLLKEKIRRKRK